MRPHRKSTNQRLDEDIEASIRADIPVFSEASHSEGRRLRGLYHEGGSSTLSNVDAPFNHAAAQFGTIKLSHQDAPHENERFAQNPWYSGGVGLGVTSSTAAHNRYGSQAESLARRSDLHNVQRGLHETSLPVDEWVPSITSGGSKGVAFGFTSGPRSWPIETENTVTAFQRLGHCSKHGFQPSFARETTVSGAESGLSELQRALGVSSSSPDPLAHALHVGTDRTAETAAVVMRGTQRGAQRAMARQAALLSSALEERKALQLQHAAWLDGSSARQPRQDESRPNRRKSKHSTLSRATSPPVLGRSQVPSTCYRAAIRQPGSGIRRQEVSKGVGTVRRLGGSLSAVVQPSVRSLLHERSHDLAAGSDRSLEKALASRLKRRHMRFERRLRVVAMVLDALHRSPSARPGNQQLVRLHEALRVCGSENPDPLVVSRSQFVTVAARTLGEFGPNVKDGKPSLGHELFSCFDPESRDRVRYDSIVCGLMLANRPDVYKLVGFAGGVPQGTKFTSLLPVLKAIFDVHAKGSASGSSVTADDCREILVLSSLCEDDLMTMDALWGEAATKLFSVRARDRTQQFSWEHFLGTLSASSVGVGDAVLVELQKQVLAYQSTVKSHLVDIANSLQASA